MSNSPRRRRPLKPGPAAQRLKPNTKPDTPDVLRALFRRNDIVGKLDRRELTLEILRENPPDPKYGQPEGTVSQMVAFFTPGGIMVARAHRFVRPPPDGPTQYDPKMVLDGHTVYYIPE